MLSLTHGNVLLILYLQASSFFIDFLSDSGLIWSENSVWIRASLNRLALRSEPNGLRAGLSSPRSRWVGRTSLKPLLTAGGGDSCPLLRRDAEVPSGRVAVRPSLSRGLCVMFFEAPGVAKPLGFLCPLHRWAQLCSW